MAEGIFDDNSGRKSWTLHSSSRAAPERAASHLCSPPERRVEQQRTWEQSGPHCQCWGLRSHWVQKVQLLQLSWVSSMLLLRPPPAHISAFA